MIRRTRSMCAFAAVLILFTHAVAFARDDDDRKKKERDSETPAVVDAPPEDPVDAHLSDLAAQIVASLSQKNKSKIAVVEFSDLNGNISEFGQFIAEELITRLYRSGNFEVVERQLLTKVIEEHTLNLSGLVDEASAKELGRILGVDAIATGSITDLGSSVKINARLISTESGAIFAVAATALPKDASVTRLMSRPAAGGKTGIAGQGAEAPADTKGGEVAVLDARRVLATVLSESEHGTYQWKEGAPYVTTLRAHGGRLGYIATGNNNFYKNFGRIGYEANEIRYVRLSVYPLKTAADMTLQLNISQTWEHRWGLSTQATPRLYGGWPVRGNALNLPIENWTDITVDLINDLGAKPGQQLTGFAFSAADGNLVYDDVVLLSN